MQDLEVRDNSFKMLNVDHYVYIKSDENGNFIVLLLYVDDTLIPGKDKNMINNLKKD